MHELSAENAPGYLRERGWISSDFCQVESLSGGVSNLVFRVKTFQGLYVLKQSCAQLRTSDPWFSDRSRIFREIDTMLLLEPLLPRGMVPRVLQRDDANCTFLMEHAPRDARDWRTVLLEGRIDPKLGEIAGRILGRIHSETIRIIGNLSSFVDRSVFEQLRVEPFYRRVAARCPDVADPLHRLIESMQQTSMTLCHGDFSPKNLLLHADGFTLVDFETAHVGDPAFDVGFILSHLFLKALMLPERSLEMAQLLMGFWRGYEDTFPFKPMMVIVSEGMRHLGGCLLARVDGASPAPYLTDEPKRAVARRMGRRILLEPMFEWRDVLDMLRAECLKLCEYSAGR